MNIIISQQLPLFKFTIAKLFALATICVYTYYSYLHFRVDYPRLFSQHRTNSNTYFVVTNSELLFSILIIGCLLTAIYFFLPQVNQVSGIIVFCLISIGTILMAWSDWFGIHYIQEMFDNSRLQNYYNTASILSLIFLGVGFVFLVGHIVYDLYIK